MQSMQHRHAGQARRFSGTVATPATKPVRAVRAASVKQEDKPKSKNSQGNGLGDLLGPIGLTIGGDVKQSADKVKKAPRQEDGSGLGDLLGPIGLTYGGEVKDGPSTSERSSEAPIKSIHSMTTEEWRAKFEQPDGTISLWMEDEFNAGSRLVGGRVVHNGGTYGIRTGEGPSVSGATKHKVTIFNHYANQTVEVEVPEDRYVMWEAEDAGLELPYACRMGCCTACAVRIKEGEMYQPEALGISQELKEKGYALMCVGYPLSELVLETVPEDEVYELQFGKAFEEAALDPSNPESIERDDFAISIANMDE